MFQCPNCNHTQQRTPVSKGVFWICRSCGGRIANIALLRQAVDRRSLQAIWKQARRHDPGPHKRPCPSCSKPMVEVNLEDDSTIPPLDVCKYCQLFWFDPKEFEALPPQVKKAEDLRELQRRLIRQQEEHGANFEPQDLRPTWQWVFFLAGMPVEMKAPRLQRLPWVTWLLAAAVTAISIVAFQNINQATNEFGFIPSEMGRYFGATFFTNFFLHVDALHLIGNMYFLIVFGDNVEDYFGKWKYVALLLLATIFGSLLHGLLEPRSDIPLVGASGGISGLIAFYALRFRGARIIALWKFIPIPLSVWWWFLFWIVIQLIGVVSQVQGVSAVSALGHMGGVCVGAAFWAVDAWSRRISVGNRLT